MPRSPEPARAALISSAERLFAEGGVAATPLSAITRAADQRNKHAVGFHFGGKDGLVDAVLAKHRSRIAAIRHEMLADVPSPPDARFIARVLVEPLADRLLDPDGGPEYLRIQADLSSRREGLAMVGETGATGELLELAESWAGRTVEELMPQVRLIIALVFHGFAEYALRNPAPTADEVAAFSSLLSDDVAALLEVGARRHMTE